MCAASTQWFWSCRRALSQITSPLNSTQRSKSAKCLCIRIWHFKKTLSELIYSNVTLECYVNFDHRRSVKPLCALFCFKLFVYRVARYVECAKFNSSISSSNRISHYDNIMCAQTDGLQADCRLGLLWVQDSWTVTKSKTDHHVKEFYYASVFYICRQIHAINKR